jgi:hypothetical protein
MSILHAFGRYRGASYPGKQITEKASSASARRKQNADGFVSRSVYIVPEVPLEYPTPSLAMPDAGIAKLRIYLERRWSALETAHQSRGDELWAGPRRGFVRHGVGGSVRGLRLPLALGLLPFLGGVGAALVALHDSLEHRGTRGPPGWRSFLEAADTAVGIDCAVMAVRASLGLPVADAAFA